jgi:uncharacterized membrane protein
MSTIYRGWVFFLIGSPLFSGPAGLLMASTPGLIASDRPRGESKDAAIERAIPLFRDHCIECHDGDGRGASGRELMRRTPDFTDSEWQRRRSDRDLARSIVKGKGAMPAAKVPLAADELETLVGLVRRFQGGRFQIPEDDDDGGNQEAGAKPAQSEDAPPGERSEATAPDVGEPAGPARFSQELIRWFGKFHPPAVHYPIAMLIAAAVAELLRMITRKPAFDPISRFCVWFGAVSAVGAGVLGWCLAGLPAGDDSRVMMTHRWIGTSTVVWAGLLLALCEASRRRDHRPIRMCFQLSLFIGAALVSIAGFTGGAVVFGLDHYAWPPR